MPEVRGVAGAEPAPRARAARLRLGAREREGFILEALQHSAEAQVAWLAERLGVSQVTIRRDLERLAARGWVERLHGRALLRLSLRAERSLAERARLCADEKRRIAAYAASLVPDGATVFLGPGTTTTEVARVLARRRRLCVVTNALTVAEACLAEGRVDVVLTGGIARRPSGALSGSLAEDTLRGLRGDVAFVGATGLTVADGLTTTHLVEAHTLRVLVASARRVVVVADHTKFGRVAFAQIAPVSAAECVVTGRELDPEAAAPFEAAGVAVVRV
jgi:DeoR family fructose operon transcriptional repressor